MTGLRMTTAIVAYEDRFLFATDAVNAYAQSGPYARPTFLVVDDTIREWYYERYKIILPQRSLLALLSSIQGHLDDGVNWQVKANTALERHRWQKTVHEPCVYRRDMGDQPDQLMCRQEDDMLLALKTKDEFQAINTELDSVLSMESEELRHHRCHYYIDLDDVLWKFDWRGCFRG